MRKTNLILAAMAAAMVWGGATADAAIVNQALYELGEAGTLAGGNLLPQDSVNSHDFISSSGTAGANSVITDTRGYNAITKQKSTAALNFNGLGYFNAGSDFIPSDNFAVEMWVRTASPNQANNTFFTTNGGPSNGTLKFHVNNGNWAASLHNVTWIGGSGGTGQPITANEWTHLAVVRDGGISNFYIDGVAQGSPTGSAPDTTAALHLGVSPGGGSHFFGDIDEARVFTFGAGDDPVAALSFSIPEPSTYAVFGGLMLCFGAAGWWRKRRQAA